MRITTASELITELEKVHSTGTASFPVLLINEYGDVGSDNNPGLWAAIRTFVTRHPEWCVINISVGNNITLISRDPTLKPELPSDLSMIWNYTKSKIRGMIKGNIVVPLDVFEERLSECALCVYRNDNRCTKCGCFLDSVPDDSPIDPGAPGKAWKAAEYCPIGKWKVWTQQKEQTSS